MDSRQNILAKSMRWAGRAIGLSAATFLVFMVIGAVISESLSGEMEFTVAGTLLGVFGIAALAGGIISWWWERLAGVVLIVVSAGMGAHIGVYAGSNHFTAWLTVGLPYLIAGGLLLYSWWLEKKTL